MTSSASSRVLRSVLFVLVPTAYLSMRFWRPYSSIGGADIFPTTAILMAAVFLISLLSWGRHRVVALLGLIACFLWLVFTMLPVL